VRTPKRRRWARIGRSQIALAAGSRGLASKRQIDPETSSIEPKQLAAAVAHIADGKKGVDIRVYDVGEQIKVADYFVVISGLSRPHVKALYDEIHVRLKALGERHSKAEGADLGWWILLDYVDVVIHILQPEAREYYALDALYGECPELDVSKVPLPAGLDEPLRMAE
jgi:ribosome-associated protein